MLSLKQDDHGNYKFGYDINDGTGGNHFHKESGDEYGNKRGSYGILDPYTGQMRIVHYIADEHGFRVDIKSNEPGLAHGKDSAAAIVNGPDPDEHSDYSSTFGQRTPGYAPSPASPLYLSSTSHHPSSKPYYLSVPAKHEDHSSAYAPAAYSPSHEPSYPSHETYIAPKPKYAHTAAKSYYPKNLAYVPKYTSSPHYYPKPVAYEAPSYSSSYSSPSYGTTSSPSYSYEPTGYPVPVHKATYSAHDADSYNAYDPQSSYNVYGTRKTPYHASDLYSKSAEPILSYTKLSGYSSKKYNEKTKYYNEPLEHLSSSAAATGVYKSPTLDTTDTVNTPDKKQEDEEVAASYRDEPKDGVISAKATASAKPSKLVSGLIGLTSYRNPYSIDTEYKSSRKK